MLKIINKTEGILNLKIKILTQRLKNYEQQELKWSAREKLDLETGRKFNDLMFLYAISDDELLGMAKTICEFTTITRIINIDKYLFCDKEHMIPRLPMDI